MDIWKHKPGDVVQAQCCDDCANRAGLSQRSRAETGVSSWLCDVCGHYGIGAQETCVVRDWLGLTPVREEVKP